MLIETLKENITNKTIDSSPIIFKTSDNDFIAFQYIDEIAKILNKDIVYIDSFDELPDQSSNFFGYIDNNIYLYKTDLLDTKINLNIDYLYIICSKISSNIKDYYDNLIVDIPKLENWHIDDYVKTICSGIDEKDLDTLLTIYNRNIYKIDNEIKKFIIFPEVERKYLFKNYLDTLVKYNSNLTIFTLSNAIIKKDIKTIEEIYKCIDVIDIEPIGLLKILYTNFRNILSIQLDRTATAKKLNLTDKQFYAIKYNTNIYSRDQLLKIFNFLCGIDLKIKLGELPMDMLIDYLIFNIIKVANND